VCGRRSSRTVVKEDEKAKGIAISRDDLNEVFPRNPLREVAFEIRFPVKLRVLRDVYLIQEELGAEYPRFERELIESPATSNSIQYVFYNPARGRIVKIGEDRFAVIFTRYRTFEEFTAEVTSRVQRFCHDFEIGPLTRMGLRYINNIHVHGNGQPPTFSTFIKPYADFDRTGPSTVEQFGIEVLMQRADCFLNARSAFALQPPAPSGICTLDFDAFIQEEVSLDKMSDFLERSHDHIQIEFLTHVTDEYKHWMRERK
jgi:uncharacterized protein (TIGR04255 family)